MKKIVISRVLKSRNRVYYYKEGITISKENGIL
jgi:hypothetical protein